MPLITPEHMLAAAQGGDRQALTELLRMHRHGVYRYGLQVCPTTEDAEDAVQETLWAATRAIATFRGPATSIVNWMFTIIRRVCFRLIDGRRRAPASFDGSEELVPACDLTPEEALAHQQQTERLASALNALDPLHREVVLLRDVQELSAPHAAARLGISVSALKSRLHRARASLREHVLARAHVA